MPEIEAGKPASAIVAAGERGALGVDARANLPA
jgi:hypothetical protein